MADLYGTSACSPALESEDMSTFLHHVLHNPSSASSSSSSCMPTKPRNAHSFMSLTPPHLLPSVPPDSKFPAGSFRGKVSPEDRRRSDRFDSDCRVGEGSVAVVGDSSSFNFTAPAGGGGGYFAPDVRDGGGRENAFSCVGGVDTEAITAAAAAMGRNFPADNDSDGYGYDSEKGLEASQVPTNPVPPRSSSKRSRAAEIHNLSEKRRRSRINEKMKALQKLIPNSNKTDKASMLDEAIEYLKQLQLQVQMLSMRNGLSMHPLYLAGGIQPMQMLQTGTSFDESNGLLNTNAGAGPITAAQETSIRTAFDLSSQCTPSNQPIIVPTLTNLTNSETPFGFEPEMEAQYRPFNLSTPSKDLGVDDALPELQLDMSRSGKMNSSSGVS